MRTTMSLDDRLVKELMAVTGAKSRTEAIHRAIAELIRRKKLEELKACPGRSASRTTGRRSRRQS